MSTHSAPLTPGPPAPITIWRFNLAHELVATAVAGLALLGGSWFAVNQLERRYLQLHQIDAGGWGSCFRNMCWRRASSSIALRRPRPFAWCKTRGPNALIRG